VTIGRMNLELVFYALVATLSPVALAATLTVMTSGRFEAVVFGVGVVAGQVGALFAVVLVDTSFLVRRDHDHRTLRAVLELVFGTAMLVLAVVLRSRRGGEPAVAAPRSSGLLDRLRAHLSAATAFVAGLVLGVGGPKRLVLTVLAGTSITASGVEDSEAALLAVGYAALATLLVWVPVVCFAIAGAPVAATLQAAERRLTEHRTTVTFYSLLGIGVIAVADGVRRLA
jgi:threonine/homoserine/homoserine lactone efflux protein